MINYSSNHITLAISLFYYLGGINNIESVNSCLSRLRINIKNIDSIASDKSFLQLKCKGIIHNEHSIHLLFGKQSIILQDILQDIINTIKDDFSSNILILCKGKSHIKDTYCQDKYIHILLDNINIISKNIDIIEQKYQISLEYNNSTLKFIFPNNSNYQLFKNKLQFWDMILSQIILYIIEIQNIKEIQIHHSYLRIFVHKLSDILEKISQKVDLLKISSNIDEQFIEFNISESFNHIIIMNYRMLTTQNTET